MPLQPLPYKKGKVIIYLIVLAAVLLLMMFVRNKATKYHSPRPTSVHEHISPSQDYNNEESNQNTNITQPVSKDDTDYVTFI